MFFKTYKIFNIFGCSRKISIFLLFLSLSYLTSSSVVLAQTSCDSSPFCKNLYKIIQIQRKIDLDKILSTVQIPKGLTKEEFQQATLDYLNAQVMNHITHRFGYGLSSAENELNFENPTETNIKSMLFSITSSIENPQGFASSLVNQLSSGFEYKTTGFGHTYNPIKMSLKDMYKFYFDIYSDLETDAVECADTKDNDRDGKYDFEDPSCYKNLFCEDPRATSGKDCIKMDLTSIRFKTFQAATQYRLLKSTFGSQRVENGKIRDSQVNFESILQEFWFNHFNVDYKKVLLGAAMGSGGYERTIHEKMTGTFFKLLQSVITHPAMLQYLDNQSNIFMLDELVASNQNLGRELIEELVPISVRIASRE